MNIVLFAICQEGNGLVKNSNIFNMIMQLIQDSLWNQKLELEVHKVKANVILYIYCWTFSILVLYQDLFKTYFCCKSHQLNFISRRCNIHHMGLLTKRQLCNTLICSYNVIKTNLDSPISLTFIRSLLI